jgi:hypothetical protein
MEMGMQHVHGHGHAAWTWTCSMDMDMQATGDGRHDRLLHLYPKQYLTTAVLTARIMLKGKPCEIFRHQPYLEALCHFFKRGTNTCTLYFY